MIIAQISDTHILAPSSDEAAGPTRAENLRRCIADINRLGVDVVIHTGDSVQNGLAEEYGYLREMLSALDVPYFLVLGNRDRRDALRSVFGDLSYLPADGEFLQYAVEDYPLRLVGLDSVVAGERKGVFPGERLAWLDDVLAAAPDRPTVLFMHHPPFDIDDHYVGGYRRPHEAENLTATVASHPQVKRLLCGHVHCLHREEGWGGTVATVMPSVAADVRLKIGPALNGETLYTVHRLWEDGELASETRIVD